MKLTNTLRDAFVRAAMNDVPQQDYKEQIRQVAAKGVIDNLPAKVRSVWDDPSTREFVQTSYFSFGDGDASCSVGEIPAKNTHGYRPHDGMLSRVDESKIAQLSKLHNEQKEMIDALRSKLRGAAYAVTTRKALAEMLPEFEKYLPADEAAVNRQLPVVANIVADFERAGWPKGEKKPAAKAKATPRSRAA